MQKIAIQRNHTVVFFENYENIHSDITIQCNTCSLVFTTTVHSYKNAKNLVVRAVKKLLLQKPIKGRSPVKKQKKQKIGKKASERPGSLTGRTGNLHPRSKGGFARDSKNPSIADYCWKNSVRKRCKYTCVVSLEKKKKSPKRFCMSSFKQL